MGLKGNTSRSTPQAEAPADSVVVRKRRDEIIAAAMEIIATEGIHRLSLARIEGRVRMSRGQLTYYFRSKEKILLAVFDRMLAQMVEGNIREAAEAGFRMESGEQALEKLRYGLQRMMAHTSELSEKTHLFSVVHTFLAQVQHRPDFRAKLAEADAQWRGHIAADLRTGIPNPMHPPEVVASIVMALFQGLGNQLAVNPQAFEPAAMIQAVVQVLEPLLGTSEKREDEHG
jgi:AcrR family transcriptional regulator